MHGCSSEKLGHTLEKLGHPLENLGHTLEKLGDIFFIIPLLPEFHLAVYFGMIVLNTYPLSWYENYGLRPFRAFDGIHVFFDGQHPSF